MERRRMIVVVPGLGGKLATWDSLLSRLKQEPSLREGTHWFPWQHHLRWWRFTEADRAAIELRAAIDQEWATWGEFDEVILMGHSFGGVLVRAAYLLGLGVSGEPKQLSPWAGKVRRIMLFAAVNRGLNGIDPKRYKLCLKLASWLTRVVPGFRRMFLADTMRGSNFITNLRIEWIREFSRLEEPPDIVQLVGTADSLVSREDSIDIEQFPSAWLVDVPGAKHKDLHRLDRAADPEGRYSLIRRAVVDPDPGGENRSFAGPQKVVFILHGIRANNSTWVEDLSQKIHRLDPTVRVIKPTYGFFSAIRFIHPTFRRRNLRWFQDQYSECLACNPDVVFTFVGHSNGTYMFGHSLARLHGMKFQRVVLAGSVLPPAFSWSTLARRRQVARVFNLRANQDFPVSFLCSALRGLGMKDVGTGGFTGFNEGDATLKEEVFWYDGGHSKALEAENLDQLAHLALDQDPSTTNLCTGQEDKKYQRFPQLAPWVARLAVVGLLGLAVLWVFLVPTFSWQQFWSGAAVVVTLFILGDVL